MSRCPVCGADAASKAVTPAVFRRANQPGSVHMPQSGQGASVGRELVVSGCKACGFFWNAAAFADPAEFSAWMAPAYQSYTLLDNDLHGFPLVDGRTRTAAGLLDAHCHWPAMRSVLEVGSNRGDFLAFLQQRHPHVQLMGVESSPLSLVGVPTLFNDVHDLRFSPSFDLVIARQVLEHMADPLRFARHVASFVRPGGWVLWEVPLLENDLAEGVDPWLMEHVGYYSPRALELLGRAAGLSLAGEDRSYQLTMLFRKALADTAAPAPRTSLGNARWHMVEDFLAGVEERQQQWRAWVEQGGEICFYGASNIYLAIGAVLRSAWGEDFWNRCRLSLADDSPGRQGESVGGLRVQTLESIRPSGRALFVVCATYRYHREKMLPRVRERLRPGDRLYAMWTPLPE